jgi:hypothetical protein
VIPFSVYETTATGPKLLTETSAHVVPRMHESMVIEGERFIVQSVEWTVHHKPRHPTWTVLISVQRAFAQPKVKT